MHIVDPKLERETPRPEVRIVPDAEALYRAAARVFVRSVHQAVQASDRFTVALSGGSTPKGLYSLLATDPASRAAVPWDKVHFFWGDERHVPPAHADNNYRMARETLLSKIPVASSQVHRIAGENPDAAQAACQYEQTLREMVQLSAAQVPRFDLVLLGLGADAHTASLFPGTRALHEQRRFVVSNWIGKLDTDRITLTAPVLNNAACVIFLVSGEDKATPLNAVINGRYEPEQLPAQLIRPLNGTLQWIVDQAAGRLLQRNPE
jgi:6-phosphogluconolactonase